MAKNSGLISRKKIKETGVANVSREKIRLLRTLTKIMKPTKSSFLICFTASKAIMPIESMGLLTAKEN